MRASSPAPFASRKRRLRGANIAGGAPLPLESRFDDAAVDPERRARRGGRQRARHVGDERRDLVGARETADEGRWTDVVEELALERVERLALRACQRIDEIVDPAR